MQKINWTDQVRNEEVLDRVVEKRQLINLVRERQARGIGHVMCTLSLAWSCVTFALRRHATPTISYRVRCCL